MNSGITQLIKSAPILTPQDTVRRAVGLIRGSGGSRVLVHDQGHIVGSVSEHAISAFLAGTDGEDAALGASVEQLIDPDIVLVNSSVSAKDAAGIFANSGADALPVIDSYGSYRGVLYRSDVVGALTQNLRPPSVGGMATPLGVYLTTGSVSGGAGSLGLFLTGVSLALMMGIAAALSQGVMLLFEKLTGVKVSVFIASVPLTMHPTVYDVPLYASVVLSAGFFFLIMRLSPLSGYHAAEHMTVHAMEAGEVLTPDSVRGMPRVHPRCGTNLLAAAAVFLLVASRVSGQTGILLALVVVMIGWRTVGGWLQYFVTTKRPSEKQLANGVAAGNDILRQFQEQPNLQLTGFQRIWKLGFPQTLAGMLTAMWIIQRVTGLPIF